MIGDRSGVLRFVNVRAAAWWAMRDALDPAHGSTVALPPSRELRVDLCSARYSKQANGIKIEDKHETKKRIGRSPDLGDAVVMANWQGATFDFETMSAPLPLGFNSGSGEPYRGPGTSVQGKRERLEQLLGETVTGNVRSSGGRRW